MSRMANLVRLGVMRGQGGALASVSAAAGYTLDLDATTGVFTDTGASTPATNDGDSVKLWQDQSGNDYHFSEESSPPTLKLNIVNGLPVVRFDGSDDLLRCANMAVRTDASGLFYIVAANSSPKNDAMLAVADEDNTTPYWMIQTLEDSVVWTVNNSTPAGNVRGDTAIGTEFRIFEFASDGDAWSQVIDGATQNLIVGSGTNSGTWIGEIAGRDSMTLGCLKRTTEGLHWAGDIARVLYYSEVHDDTLRAQVRALLASQYNIEVP